MIEQKFSPLYHLWIRHTTSFISSTVAHGFTAPEICTFGPINKLFHYASVRASTVATSSIRGVPGMPDVSLTTVDMDTSRESKLGTNNGFRSAVEYIAVSTVCIGKIVSKPLHTVTILVLLFLGTLYGDFQISIFEQTQPLTSIRMCRYQVAISSPIRQKFSTFHIHRNYIVSLRLFNHELRCIRQQHLESVGY